MAAGSPGTILIVGASRGLGHGMAAEFVRKGWRVIGTVRGEGTALHDLAREHPDQVEIETLDLTDAGQLASLSGRLAGRVLDILFVNAGTTNRHPEQTIGEVSTEEFIHLMVTNALSPMRVVERLAGLVPPTGLIGVMSSGQGSIGNNETGQRELYRGSKAALNMFMRSYAAREPGKSRALVVMAPGWIRTALGGPEAPMTIESNVPKLVDVLLGKQGRPGISYVDYQGRTVPW